MINERDIQVVDGFYCLIMFVNFYVTVFQINNESTSNLRSLPEFEVWEGQMLIYTISLRT